MDIEGVLVSYDISIDKSAISPSFTSSGLKFNEKWILVHGSILSPLKITEKLISDDKLEYILCEKKCKNVNVRITHDGHTQKGNEHLLPDIVVQSGKFVYIWKCPLLKKTVNTLMSDWNIGSGSSSNNNQDGVDKNYLSIFAVIYIGNDRVKRATIENNLRSLYDVTLKRPPIRGEEVHLECTPFGNEVFLNSRTVGIVCNCVGYENCLVITDATSVMCSEGGPAFLGENKKIMGIVISSLSWWKGEWVGMSLVACLAPCLYKFANTNNSLELNITSRQFLLNNLLDTVDSVVVLVRCGDTWGSGVSIGNGYYLTCSHVIIDYNLYGTAIYCGGKKFNVNVVIKTPDDKAYDLALLRLKSVEEDLPYINLASTPAIKGETVVAIGFPYFSEMHIHDVKPTISKGCINNVTPFTIQTSCCVQSGFSGGAIMRLFRKAGDDSITCELLGIIVCNAKNENTNVSYPFINMAIPVNAFKKTLHNVINNSKSISTFEDNRNMVQTIWKFQFPSNL